MDSFLPRYTCERLLGEGGMGKVYLATDNQLQRQVAIKELTPSSGEQAQNENVNLALKEARLLARVNHSNIIQIYNIHEQDGKTSLIMEYFKSKTLSQFQNETMTTLVQKLDLLTQLAAGLAQAHQDGIVHCDLKPTNILVNKKGQLKITDFGIARLMSNNNNAPSTDQPQYTVESNGCLFFMSPEQITLQPVDFRSDIFSFGIISYQLMVGSHPFGKGSTLEVANRICQQTPEHAKNLMIATPTALTDLLMEMLIKPVTQRTLTASIIENRLRHIRTALLQADINEQATLVLANINKNPVPNLSVSVDQTANIGEKPKYEQPKGKRIKIGLSLIMLCLFIAIIFWFYSGKETVTKHVVILEPVLNNSSLMAPMQQDLAVSAIEDALRQAVINTENMYLISQREVRGITKAYPDDLNRLQQAVGASDIISTALECNNNRCKISFSRLVANVNNTDSLAVKSEKNWLTPIEKFGAIYSASQTQFASLYPELSDVNLSGLVQRPINEGDYRDYIALYSQIRGQGQYSAASLDELEAILIRSPYLYAAYPLYRDIALDLYLDSQDSKYLEKLDGLLQRSPPEYRYSADEAVERFWLVSDMGEMNLAKQQIEEAQQRGVDELIILELRAYMYFNSGQYKAAAASYESAFKLRPSATLLYNIAFSYWRIGDLKKSEAVLHQMLDILPGHYFGRRLQANIWLLQGKLKKAIAVYESINSKNNLRNLTNLSIAYSLNHQYQEALKYAHLAVKESPKNTIRLLNLADIQLMLGKVKLANKNYQKILASPASKTKYRYWLDLAQAYIHLHQEGLAIASLNKAKGLAPNNGEVSYTSALIYSLLKEKSSAIHYVKSSLENNVGGVWFNLPWFDTLCPETKFQQLMLKYHNPSRCLN